MTLEGVVVGEPDERLMLPDGLELQVNDLVLVKADRYPQRNYGDRVLVEGRLETPPLLEDFSYKDYLARQGIHSMVRRAEVTRLAERRASPILYHLFESKRHARSTIARILPEPQAALLTGSLLGVEMGIPRDLMDDFSATGTTHIIAISGFKAREMGHSTLVRIAATSRHRSICVKIRITHLGAIQTEKNSP